MSKHKTHAEIIAEYRHDADAMDRRDLYQPTTQYLRKALDRLEAAWKRERQMIIDEANDDTALVKNCATCKHYCRNKKYCPAQDTVNVNPDILPIFRTGPCDKWKCKYTKE